MKKNRLLIGLLALALSATGFAGCAQATKDPVQPAAPTETQINQSRETIVVPTSEVVEEAVAEEVIPEKTFDTEYIPLHGAHTEIENLQHESITEGNRITERFFMMCGETELELFRFYYGDEWSGNYLGALTIDGEKISVTVDVPEYGEGTFADEETESLYYELMGMLNGMITEIQKDERFEDPEKVVVKTEEKQLSYWKFTLPAGMKLEESNAEDGYLATFYGDIDGYSYKLYTVSVGGNPLKTVLGSYSVDGVSKTVSVESEELPDTSWWKEENVLELYKMMDSINDVIQTIMESEGFSDQTVEAP